jgi:hypothetical protein
MGGGAPRELSKKVEVKPLDAELSKHVGLALAKLDEMNPEFKQNREDEKNAQLTKTWMDVNLIIAEQLRLIGIALIEAHQIALESGTEGGGQGATPWCEEGAGAIPRLEFKLNGDKIDAISNDKVLAQGKVSLDIPYDWTERVVVKWILTSVKAMNGG